MNRWLVLVGALVATSVFAAEADWIAESNRHAQILLDVSARYAPESAASLGVEGYDAQVFDLKPQFAERQEADLEPRRRSSRLCAQRRQIPGSARIWTS